MKTLLTILFLLMTHMTYAQDAGTYFHSAANTYCKGDMAKATQTLNEGLAKYPNDPKLNKLKKKLEEEKKKEDEKKKKEEEKKKEDEKKKQDQQKKEEDKKNQDDKDKKDDKNQDNKKEEQDKRPQPQQSKLSEKQAEQLLNALQQEEKKLQDKHKKAKGTPVKVEKDW